MLATDRDRFTAMLERLAGLLPPKEPLSDAMVQTYWDSLRDLPIEVVEACALSHQRSRRSFPLPTDLRPRHESEQESGPARNQIRDHWRGVIVREFARCLGHTAASFEPVLVEHKTTLGVSMRALLDELEQQERRDGRTEGQHRYVMRMAEAFARSSPSFCTQHAPRLPPAPADAEPELAF